MPSDTHDLDIPSLTDRVDSVACEIMYLAAHVETYGRNPYRMTAVGKVREASTRMQEAKRLLSEANADLEDSLRP